MDAKPPGQIVVAGANVGRIPRPNAIAWRATEKRAEGVAAVLTPAAVDPGKPGCLRAFSRAAAAPPEGGGADGGKRNGRAGRGRPRGCGMAGGNPPRNGRAHRRAAPGPRTLQRGWETGPAAAFGVGHVRAAFLLAARWRWSRANTSLEHRPGRSCGTRRSSLPTRVTRDRVSGPCDRRAGLVPPTSTSNR